MQLSDNISLLQSHLRTVFGLVVVIIAVVMVEYADGSASAGIVEKRCAHKYHHCPPCRAAKDLDPLCASNGKTYDNADIFNCAKECRHGRLVKTKDGPCDEDKDKYGF